MYCETIKCLFDFVYLILVTQAHTWKEMACYNIKSSSEAEYNFHLTLKSSVYYISAITTHKLKVVQPHQAG